METGNNVEQPTAAAPMEVEEPLPFNLPPYPKLIMEAIEACTDRKGCSKAAIVCYVESSLTTLPPSNRVLLSYNINKMKNSGQIAMKKNNNYIIPGREIPKRPPGRPPKSKSLVDSTQVASTSARPPKAKVSSSSEAPSGSGRPRGRPKKANTEGAVGQQPEGERRGRGRPPKVKPAL